MTDNRTNSQNISNQQPSASTDNSKRTVTQTVSPNSLNIERTAAGNSTKAADTKMKKVDIVIAGVTYPIFCPVHEEEELRSAVYHINNSALDIKKAAPNLTQENLLVLCCLNLYETINSNKKSENKRRNDNGKTEALINKIMQDAQSIL